MLYYFFVSLKRCVRKNEEYRKHKFRTLFFYRIFEENNGLRRDLTYMILITQTCDDQSPHMKRRKQHRDVSSSAEVCNPSSRPGKIRGALLPQEYELQRLISDVMSPDPSWKTSTAACDWAGVTCNEQGEVTEIDWSYSSVLRAYGGSIARRLYLEHIPEPFYEYTYQATAFLGSIA